MVHEGAPADEEGEDVRPDRAGSSTYECHFAL